MRHREWVLVAEGGSGQARSALAAVRALAAGGYRPAVTVSGRFSLAASSRYCERSVRVPRVEEAGFAAAVHNELNRGYLTVLPVSDAALLALGAPVGHLIDKDELTRRATSAGIPTPPSRVFKDPAALRAAGTELDYPLVVKPAVKVGISSSLSAMRIGSPSALETLAVHAGPIVVQPYLPGPVTAVCGVAWQSKLVASVHQRCVRTWRPDCGGCSSAETIPPDEDLEGPLLRLLDGYDGIFHAQFMGHYLIDLNARVYGTLPLAVAAGANLVTIFCDLLRGEPPSVVRGRVSAFYRWIEGDTRSLWSATRRGQLPVGAALRAMAPRKGTAHSTESLTDPAPMLSRLRYAVGR